MNLKRIIVATLVFFPYVVVNLFATHNVSRYFPFLERTEEYLIKKRSHLTTSFLYLNASTSFNWGGGNGGIPELWGKYDLKDVIASLQTVDPTADPIFAATGGHVYDGRSIRFKAGGKMRGQGILLNYEHDTKWAGLQFGASLPIIHLSTTSRFDFDRQASDAIFNDPFLSQHALDQQEFTVDKIRRQTHQTIGFRGNLWDETGFGDLDLHVRWNHIFDHVLMMRTIDLNLQFGVIVPTGITSENDSPISLSIGSNGHWGIYGDIVTGFEMKQDLTIGLMLGLAHLFPHTRNIKIPVATEPAIFSSLIGRVRMEPGLTFKFSPYLVLGNLTDGLDFQVRYTYLRHNIDHWQDVGNLQQSYLHKDSSIVRQKEDLSKWRAHYITMQVTYDTKVAEKNCIFDPVLIAGYDIPVSGGQICKTHQITVGIEWHF